MKRLLFNGCSFTAGDYFCVNKYMETKNDVTKKMSFHEIQKYVTEIDGMYYHDVYKRRLNLPSRCANLLETTVIDLSNDGNNNMNIASDTIMCLQEMSSSDRQNIHVIIGWTEPSRFTKYIKSRDSFNSITIHSLENFKKEDGYELMKAYFLCNHDNDYVLSYKIAITLLESYLIANNISYTFFQGVLFGSYKNAERILEKNQELSQALSDSTSDTDRSRRIRQISHYCKSIQFLNEKRWYLNEYNDSHSIHPGIAWNKLLSESEKFNGHPNDNAIIAFSKELSKFIFECV